MGFLQWLQSVITLNHFFRWDIVWKYLLAAPIIQGTILTIILSVISQLLGTLIGLFLYFMRRSRWGIFQLIANGYIWFFRGTPLIVQVLVFYTLLPYLRLANPLRAIDFFGQIGFTHGTGQVFLDSFLAGLLAFSLNEGAYMAEIVRAGIDAIDVGQLEAAKSLGMTYRLAMRRIILPQAFRVIVPPLGNEFNNMLKNTSLAAFISLDELLGTARLIGDPLFATLELLLVASVWYLLLTTVWGFIQGFIERRLNAANIEPGASQANWWKRAFGMGQANVGQVPVVPEHRESGRI
ncbi:MAG TPA: amino acid ABC transporter permease [Ktedonobacterales bacterium]|nr:amino acid ABC transporter permease [Ktedonobacterales bacterium]